MNRRTLLSLSLSPWPLSSIAQPAPAYPPELVLGGTKLVLNGSGTRFRAVFRVYDLGLYVAQRSSNAEELIVMPGPKRLAFVALRDIPGTDLGRMLLKGLRDNNPRDTITRYLTSVGQLGDIFSRRSRIQEGESFQLDVVPGKGISVHVQGAQIGDSLSDTSFFPLLMRIWLGPDPVDHSLKSALLGARPPAFVP